MKDISELIERVAGGEEAEDVVSGGQEGLDEIARNASAKDHVKQVEKALEDTVNSLKFAQVRLTKMRPSKPSTRR